MEEDAEEEDVVCVCANPRGRTCADETPKKRKSMRWSELRREEHCVGNKPDFLYPSTFVKFTFIWWKKKGVRK